MQIHADPDPKHCFLCKNQELESKILSSSYYLDVSWLTEMDRRERKDIIAIAIETGIQNTG